MVQGAFIDLYRCCMFCSSVMKIFVSLVALIYSCSVAAIDLSQESAYQFQIRRIYIHDYDLRFASIGIRYLYKPLELSGFGLEPYTELLIRTEGDKRQLDFVPQVGLEVSYTLIGHSPFVGAYGSGIRSKIYDGARVGYRYFIGQHVLGVAFDRQQAEEDTYESTSLIYAYTF